MPVWKTVLFLLSSLYLASSCATKAPLSAGIPAACRAVYENRGKDAHYRASVKVAGNHLSGILILKETSPDTTHAVFINETGFRFFDILVLTDTAVVAYLPERMNRPLIQRVLCLDMQLLAHPASTANPTIIRRNKQLSVTFANRRQSTEYRCNETCDTLDFILFRKNRMKKVKVKFDGVENQCYKHIVLSHVDLPVKLNLELIER
jgi:hypothetical protein